MISKAKILVGLSLLAIIGTAAAQWQGGGGGGGGRGDRERMRSCMQGAIRIQVLNGGQRYIMEDKSFTVEFKSEREDIAEEGSTRLDAMATSYGFALLGGVNKMICKRIGHGS